MLVRTEGIKLSHKDKKRWRTDLLRSLRVIEYLDFSRIYDNSPVEVLEGYTVSDTETNEVFAVFKIQNTGNKEIKALSVRLLLYEGTSNIPTRRIDHTYSAERKNFGIRKMPQEQKKSFLVRCGILNELFPRNIRVGESFGESSFIKLPHSYCRKIEFEIRTVYYADGGTDVINTVSGKKYTSFRELDEDLRYAYRKLNVFYRAEEEHPIKIIPQSTDRVWLCCCGHKNLNSQAECMCCGRGKEWQLSNITEESLNTELDRIRSAHDPNYVHIHKSAAGKQLQLETEEERKKKADAVEKALANVAKQEQNRKDGKRLVVTVIVALIIFYIVATLIYNVFLSESGREGFGAQSQGGDAGENNDNRNDAPADGENAYFYNEREDFYL